MMQTMNRRDLLLAAGALLLLAVAIVRMAVPDRSRLRPLSVESFSVVSAEVAPGATVTREAEWSPAADVYVMGWNPWISLPAGVSFDVDVMIYQPDTKTTLFVMGQRGTSPGVIDVWREVDLPAGTGFMIRRGQPLKLRLRVTNNGATPFATRGATALVYFVPVEGN
jgi:hypothetical protein